MSAPESGARPRLLVACLCAAWCGSCRDYRGTFEALAASFDGQADFAWVDVEDEADALGDLDIENFPTLFIARADEALFLGPVTPQPGTAERLIKSALEGALAAGADAEHPGLAARVHMVATKAS